MRWFMLSDRMSDGEALPTSPADSLLWWEKSFIWGLAPFYIINSWELKGRSGPDFPCPEEIAAVDYSGWVDLVSPMLSAQLTGLIFSFTLYIKPNAPLTYLRGTVLTVIGAFGNVRA